MPQEFCEFLRITACGDRTEPLAIIEQQAPVFDAAQAVRFFQDGIEDRREITGRRIDDLQYLGGRGLLFAYLVTFGSAFGKFSLTLGKLTLQIGYKLLGIG